jgi:hypothetical protein
VNRLFAIVSRSSLEESTWEKSLWSSIIDNLGSLAFFVGAGGVSGTTSGAGADSIMAATSGAAICSDLLTFFAGTSGAGVDLGSLTFSVVAGLDSTTFSWVVVKVSATFISAIG